MQKNVHVSKTIGGVTRNFTQVYANCEDGNCQAEIYFSRRTIHKATENYSYKQLHLGHNVCLIRSM